MGDVHMKVSIPTASHIATQLSVARVRDRDRVRVRLAIARPVVCINLERLYTRLRAKLAVCIASAVSHQGVVTV